MEVVHMFFQFRTIYIEVLSPAPPPPPLQHWKVIIFCRKIPSFQILNLCDCRTLWRLYTAVQYQPCLKVLNRFYWYNTKACFTMLYNRWCRGLKILHMRNIFSLTLWKYLSIKVCWMISDSFLSNHHKTYVRKCHLVMPTALRGSVYIE